MKRLLNIVPLALALSVISTSPALAANKTDQSNVPTDIRVPDGYKRVLSLEGHGFQIYGCDNGAWKLSGPKADLIDEPSGKQVGIHYGGPTWESTKDGSKVVGAVETRVNAPDPQSDIQWLRLKATSNSGKGVFDDVAYIQRLDTAGGTAPAGSCVAGQTTQVRYTTTYDFWAPKH